MASTTLSVRAGGAWAATSRSECALAAVAPLCTRASALWLPLPAETGCATGWRPKLHCKGLAALQATARCPSNWRGSHCAMGPPAGQVVDAGRTGWVRWGWRRWLRSRCAAAARPSGCCRWERRLSAVPGGGTDPWRLRMGGHRAACHMRSSSSTASGQVQDSWAASDPAARLRPVWCRFRVSAASPARTGEQSPRRNKSACSGLGRLGGKLAAASGWQPARPTDLRETQAAVAVTLTRGGPACVCPTVTARTPGRDVAADFESATPRSPTVGAAGRGGPPRST